MAKKVYIYDPTASDKLSAVRGIGRYLQILKENFPEWNFTSNLTMKQWNNLPAGRQGEAIFINPFFNFLQKPIIIRRIAHKQIAVIHDLIPLKYPSHFPVGAKGTIYILLNKLALKNYDLIITDSEASKTDIIKILGIKESKIKVIYPCLPKIFINNKLQMINDKSISNFKFQNSNSYCLYVGDATWNKNLVNLAKAIKLTNVKCVFVGKVFDIATGGEKKGIPTARTQGALAGMNSRQNLSLLEHPWQSELKEFFKLTNGDPRFIFKGFVKDYELIKLYQQAIVNILPSRDEGFGFSYLEAGINSCPSLLSDIPVLREISDDNGLFFNPDDPADIAEKIKKIYHDDKLRQKLIINSKKRSSFFSSKTFKIEMMRQM